MASKRTAPEDVPEGTDTLRPTPPPRAMAVTIIAQDPSVKDRKTRDAVRSVLERFTGGGLGLKPAAPDTSAPPATTGADKQD